MDHKHISKLKRDRMNEDLELANDIDSTLAKLKYIVILDNGYGIDAVCAGKITRFHHDLDLLLLSHDMNIIKINLLISKILTKHSSVRWVSKPTSKNWLWFQELSDKKFPRQINIHTVSLLDEKNKNGYLSVKSRVGSKYKLCIRKTKIIDFDDKCFVFKTLTPEEYISNKIRLIPKYSRTWNIRESDLYDFKQLLHLKDINLTKALNLLEKYLSNNQSRDDNPQEKAFYYWKRLVKKYSLPNYNEFIFNR